MANKKRKYRLVVTTRFGGVRMVYRTPEGKFSYSRGKEGRAYMTAPQVEAGKKWARKHAAKATRVVTGKQSPFIIYPDGVQPPTNKRLVRALNTTGRRRRRFIKVISGWRTPHEAWQLRDRWNRYQHGGPPANLAAPCCSKYGTATTIHSWANCGKDPWSNHADGNAADCGVIGRTGGYTSLADDGKARKIFQKLGGCFPVTSPWEPWHAEMVK